jgi:glycosyltransferase involved in cell wall biosynthesis
MIRICGSLAGNGYTVKLVGAAGKDALPLQQRNFLQHRLFCRFNKGFLFYAEYNLRLFFYLMAQKTDLICAIDLDTILPCLVAAVLKRTKRVYDAHELFCEMKEVVTRPNIRKVWKAIERIAVPQFKNGYTVSAPIARIFKNDYQVEYAVIRNIAKLKSPPAGVIKQKIILYQGAVNEGRSFETLIPAMQWVNAPLHIYGEGNYLEQVKSLIAKYELENKVFLKGKLLPEELSQVTFSARIGLTLFENNGQSNYYSLANRFFDYIQAGVPQLCVDYPAYREINEMWEVAVLTYDLSPLNVAKELNNLLDDTVLYERLRRNCLAAASKLNWEQEEKILLELYKKILA